MGNSRLVISVPAGSPNESAATRMMADDQEHDRRLRLLRHRHVSSSPTPPRAAPRRPLRLSYLHYVAEGPACGRWPTNLAARRRNLNYDNFGCAQQRNLAAQIANPADLLGPRSMTPSDAERRAVVIGQIRRTARSPLRQRPPEQTIGTRSQGGILRSAHEQASVFHDRRATRSPDVSWCRWAAPRTIAPAHAKARPIPRISIQAFCENVATAEVVQGATGDRRLAKSHVSVHMGGAPAAVAHYHESPTPNLIIVETTLPRAADAGRARPPRRSAAMPAPRWS